MESNSEFTQGPSSNIIEGVGNDVLVTFIVTLGVVVVAAAWYSTRLTAGQTNLPERRYHRQGVRVTRIPGSSSAEYARAEARDSQPQQQESEDTEVEIPAANLQHPDDDEESTSNVTAGNQGSGVDDDAIPVSSPSSAANEPSDVSNSQPEPSASHEPVDPETSSSSAETPTSSNEVSVKLMSLEPGEERVVKEPANATIGELRTKYYSAQVSEGKRVRFIHSGRALLDDDQLGRLTRTGEFLVLHVSIAAAQRRNDSPNETDVSAFNAGVFMVPMFAVILILIWFLQLQYSHLFNVTSTVSLAGITAVFLYSLYAVHQAPRNLQRNYNTSRTYNIRIPPHDQTAPNNTNTR